MENAPVIVNNDNDLLNKWAKEEKDNGKGDLQVYGDCEVESEEAADIQNEELEDRTESNNEETETVTEEETEAPDEE